MTSPLRTSHLLLLAALALTVAGCGGCDDDPKPTNQQPNNGTNNAPNNGTNNAPNNGTNNDPNNGMTDNNGACPAGTEGCACRANDACDAGLRCEQARCVTDGASGFTVSNPDARSCEVALQENTTHLQEATFAGSVRGTMLRRPPRAALAFTQTEDAPIPAGAVGLRLDGPTEGVTVSDVRCFDRNGQPLDGVEIRLQ